MRFMAGHRRRTKRNQANHRGNNMNRSMTWWIRAFLISSALRGLLLGINGLVNYREISIPLQFTPLNAAFVAGLYLAGTIGLILTLFARERADARPFLIGTAVVTT